MPDDRLPGRRVAMPLSIEAAGSTLSAMQKTSRAYVRAVRVQSVAVVLGPDRGFKRVGPEGLVDNLSRIVNDPSKSGRSVLATRISWAGPP